MIVRIVLHEDLTHLLLAPSLLIILEILLGFTLLLLLYICIDLANALL